MTDTMCQCGLHEAHTKCPYESEKQTDESAAGLRPETTSEHIARDIREGRFPERSVPQMVAEQTDERAAFEAWMKSIGSSDANLERWVRNEDQYSSQTAQAAWEGWQARATIPNTVAGSAGQAPHADDAAVDAFAVAMKEKLAQSRAKGRSGWEQCDPAVLSNMLRKHVEKGDPRDVANFCMMLWHHAAPIAPSLTIEEREAIEIVLDMAKMCCSERCIDNLGPIRKLLEKP